MRDAPRTTASSGASTKDGRSSYLYGTIHAAQADVDVSRARRRSTRCSASDTLALELDVLDPDVQRRLAPGIGGRADEPLPPALVARLERAADGRSASTPQPCAHVRARVPDRLAER